MGGICTRREANGRGDVKAEPKIKTLENDNKDTHFFKQSQLMNPVLSP